MPRGAVLPAALSASVLAACSGEIPFDALPETKVEKARLSLSRGSETIPPFEIPPTVVGEILAALRPARVDPEPTRRQALGTLVLIHGGERLSVVELFRRPLQGAGDDEAAFRYGGRYYRGGSQAALLAAAFNAHQRSLPAPAGIYGVLSSLSAIVEPGGGAKLRVILRNHSPKPVEADVAPLDEAGTALRVSDLDGLPVYEPLSAPPPRRKTFQPGEEAAFTYPLLFFNPPPARRVYIVRLRDFACAEFTFVVRGR